MKAKLFGNPYLMCNQCKHRAVGVDGQTLLFCEHRAEVTSRCSTWSPVDGCTCTPTCTVPSVAKYGVVT